MDTFPILVIYFFTRWRDHLSDGQFFIARFQFLHNKSRSYEQIITKPHHSAKSTEQHVYRRCADDDADGLQGRIEIIIQYLRTDNEKSFGSLHVVSS